VDGSCSRLHVASAWRPGVVRPDAGRADDTRVVRGDGRRLSADAPAVRGNDRAISEVRSSWPAEPRASTDPRMMRIPQMGDRHWRRNAAMHRASRGAGRSTRGSTIHARVLARSPSAASASSADQNRSAHGNHRVLGRGTSVCRLVDLQRPRGIERPRVERAGPLLSGLGSKLRQRLFLDAAVF
jgi:hypothetical protein